MDSYRRWRAVNKKGRVMEHAVNADWDPPTRFTKAIYLFVPVVTADMDVQALFGLPEGFVVVVTGGGRGIGSMIAETYVACGATVYISSRDAKACEATTSRLTSKGPGRCIALPGDLSSESECVRLAEEVTRREGRINVLVNNSGISYTAPFDTTPDGPWSGIMHLNLQRVFTLTQKFMPLLEEGVEQNGTGRVINIGSVYGVGISKFENYAYSASKAALHHLTKQLALNLGPRGVTVNALALGPFPTDLMASSGQAEISESLPLKRVGGAEDVGGTCIWLSSRAGPWVTGAIIPVDGGSLVLPRGVL